ncbi:hypothetical protein CPAR01_13985 [Colletotrichum paranaense]|uniref:Uncharacterized protein n=1 Tax=Colletotrichum paranaense TaxID=1914294 RepID=A0ABQ9S2V0_9PEZI|nr:uncharacterized protein CPAR01_13985 [Colletotrichum paranaense]KAK1523132.1 hypothetical protein CPAR01_13985 [Colletotrichum paranaense]
MLLFHSIYALISRFAREHSITIDDAPMPVALGCFAGLLQKSNKPVHRRCIQAPHQVIAQFLDAEVSTLGQGWSEDQIMCFLARKITWAWKRLRSPLPPGAWRKVILLSQPAELDDRVQTCMALAVVSLVRSCEFGVPKAQAVRQVPIILNRLSAASSYIFSTSPGLP